MTDHVNQDHRQRHSKRRALLDYVAQHSARLRRLHPPLLATELPNFQNINTRLREKFHTMAATEPDAVSNSPGGPYFENKWLSANNLYPSQDQDLLTLSTYIETFANGSLGLDTHSRLSIDTMWCIVSRDGLSGKQHFHNGKVSGAYYVDAGEVGETTNGAIQFFPRWGNTLKQQSLFGQSVWGEPLWPHADQWNANIAQYHDGVATVKPRAGLLLLFPAHLLHRVHHYQGQRERIVVSFNLR